MITSGHKVERTISLCAIGQDANSDMFPSKDKEKNKQLKNENKYITNNTIRRYLNNKSNLELPNNCW